MHRYTRIQDRFAATRSIRKFPGGDAIRGRYASRRDYPFRTSSIPRWVLHCRGFLRDHALDEIEPQPRQSWRTFAFEIARKTVALAYLVGGIVAVAKIPALLLPLLPLEALITFELILGGDRAHLRDASETRKLPKI
jgi:hypothetical protein